MRQMRVMQEARAALDRLRAGRAEGMTRSEMFAPKPYHGTWRERFAARLFSDGLMRLVGGREARAGRQAKLFAANPALAMFIGNDGWLSDMLWPRDPSRVAPRSASIPISETIAAIASVTARGQEAVITAPHREPAEPPTDAPSREDKLDALLQMQDITMQNVVYMRERLDALTEQVEALGRIWQ
jgi:hypothetical protein